jgi:acetyl esterase
MPTGAYAPSRGRSPAPTPPPSGSARPAPGSGSGVALLPEIRALLDQMAARGRPPLHRQAVAQARVFYVEDSPALIGPAAAVASVAGRVVPGPAGDLPVRVYTPEGEPPFPIVVWFHGGGWVVGTLDTYDPLCRALAAAVPAVVVSVDYRLAPEHPYPAAVEDAYAATAWASRNAAALGGAQHRLAVAGDSAGGNLAAVVALGARDRGGPAIAFQLLVYPVLDAAGDTGSWAEFAEGHYLTAAGMRWYWDHYLAGADGGAPDASPLRAASVGGLPPALVIGADHDILRDEGEAYAARLRDAGIDATATRYPGVVHGFFRWRAVTAAADTALREAATALRSALAPPGAA